MTKQRLFISLFLFISLISFFSLASCTTDLDPPSKSSSLNNYSNTESNSHPKSTKNSSNLTETQSKLQSTSTSTPVIINGCVTVHSLNVRNGPGVDYEIIGGLLEDECVSLIGRNKKSTWGKVIFSDVSGWISLNYLSTENDIENLPVASIDDEGDLSSQTQTAVVTLTPLPTVTKKPRDTNTPRPSPTRSILDCQYASNYVGSYITCKIPYAYCSYQPSVSGKPTFCNDAPYPNHNFTLVVWGNDVSYLNGNCILISGYVTTYQGKPQIEKEDISGITYCD